MGNYFCGLCDSKFHSQIILDDHLAGAKHRKKEKAEEILESLQSTDPEVGRDSSTGELQCSLCNVTFKAAHILKKHVSTKKHRANKGEDVSELPDDDDVNGEGGKPQDAETKKKEKKERPPLPIVVPDCVTKLEENKSGGKFFCNLCQAHCNSDIQLQQHLSCKKHMEKVNSQTAATATDTEEDQPS